MEAEQLKPGDVIKRHKLSVRLWHWTNALAMLVMLMSGLMIFNAHPRLYWGKSGNIADRAWLEIGDTKTAGFVKISGAALDTTGVLGLSIDGKGELRRLAFPDWATIPSAYSLSAARRWHFSFAWLFSLALTAFMLRALFNGHIRNDLHIQRSEWSPRHIWRDVKDHARLSFPTGAAAARYSILQKNSYIAVIFLLLPLMIFTGIAMSPAMNTAWPWLLDIFGGRQSARSIHFICAFALVSFFVVHILMVLLAGPANEIRSMVTGYYRLPGKVDADSSSGETS
jgi:thiosulfate reductase cytochrome b subunit